MNAIVIGGGIGGLTAAIALRQVGIDAHIYERAPKPNLLEFPLISVYPQPH